MPAAAPDRSAAGLLAARLCLTCGLCCDGTLFKDVQVAGARDRDRLAAWGVRLQPASGRSTAPTRLPQPCQALDGCTCRVYPDRPSRCRDFECLLFKSVLQGKTGERAAGRIVRTAVQRRDRVRGLLAELGDQDSGAALSIRFRRMRERFERGGEQDAGRLGLFGDLTMAVHDLNLALSQAFYPGD